MREEINRMLDSVYELEGLLHLMLTREEIPAALPRLVREKAARIAALGAAMPEVESSTHAEVAVCEEVAAPAPALAPVATSAPAPAPVEAPAPVAAPALVVPPAPVKAPVAPAMQGASAPRQADRVPVFSLNDKFLFTRQLFDGRRAAFDDALNRVAAMQSEAEARQYFIQELGWDAESEDVVAFMSIISNFLRHE